MLVFDMTIQTGYHTITIILNLITQRTLTGPFCLVSFDIDIKFSRIGFGRFLLVDETLSVESVDDEAVAGIGVNTSTSSESFTRLMPT